jgi:replicative DNA helicase
VPEKSLQEELKKARDKKRAKMAPSSSVAIKQRVFDWSERILIRLMILNPENIEKIKGKIKLDHFSDQALKDVAEFLFEMNLLKERISSQTVVERISFSNTQGLRKIVTELLMETIEFDNPNAVLEDCVQAILKKARRSQIESLKKERIQAVKFRDDDKFQKLDKDLKDLQGF